MSQSLLNKIYFGITLLMASFPIWSAKIIPIIIILWSFSSVFMGIYQLKTNKIKLGSIKPLLIQSSLFIVILIWSLVIDGSNEAHFYLERSLSLLIFPIGFYFNPIKFTTKQLSFIKLIFISSTLILIGSSSLFAFNDLTTRFVGPNLPCSSISELLSRPEFHYEFRTAFENFSGLHPTYASMYLGISFLFILDIIISRYKDSFSKTIIYYGISLILILFLMASIASRTPFIATIIASITLLFFILKRKIYILYTFLFLLLTSVVLYLTVPSFSARFSQISINNTEVPSSNKEEDSFNMRTGILHCSIEVIKSNWLMGVGPGNVQTELNNCYNTIAPEVYKGKEFNSHNQFLGYWAAMGIMGISSFLLILLSSVIVSYKNKNFIPVTLSLFFSICFLTENIMVRQQGIVAISFFINLFYFLDVRTKMLKDF